MQTKLAAAALLGIGFAAPIAAQAADAIKGGKWEYTVTTQMPNMPQLPPGVKLPPNVQLGAGPGGGMTVTHTSCVAAGDPTAELRRPHGPSAAQTRCGIEKLERVGGTATWATTCTSPEAVVHSEGTAHFMGDRMDGIFKTRTTPTGGAPIEVTNRLVGRYLGPCDTAR